MQTPLPPEEWIPVLLHVAYWEDKEKFLYFEDTYDDWVVFTVEKGAFYYEIEQAKGTAAFGDLVICPPGIPFRRVVIEPLTFNVLRLEWRTISHEMTETCKMLHLLPVGKISIQNTKRLSDNYQAMREARTIPEPVRMMQNQHYLYDIWLLYSKEHNLHRSVAAAQSIPTDPLMQQARILIHRYAYEPLNLKDIALSLNISAVQLTRKFKTAFGTTPIQYLTELRLAKIKKLLLETTLTIDQISECCGYQNGFYLSRIFTRHENVTPSEYRKLHQI